jgi:3-oxoacyl-[acyl-carrier-protein] synthase III
MIPHQANRRIIAAAAERLGINCDRVVINIDQYGNTTGATIPLATRDALRGGKLKKGRSGAVRRGGRRLHGGREPVALADVAPASIE